MATNDIGRVTPIWRGFFSAATTYELNDIVIDTAGSVWWHKSPAQTTGEIPEAGEIWDAVIDMSVFSGLIQSAIVTAQTALEAAREAVGEVSADTERAETAAQNAETSALNAAESAAGVGAQAQAAERSAEAAADSATGAAGSAEAAAGSKSDAEAYAVGKRGGEDVETTDPTFHNNAKYYSEQAESSAEAAAQSAEDAQEVLDSIPADYSTLSADVGDLKESINSIFSSSVPVEWEIGTINANTGNPQASTTRIRTVTAITPVSGKLTYSFPTGYKANVYVYTGDTFTKTGFVTTGGSILLDGFSSFKVVFAKSNDGTLTNTSISSNLSLSFESGINISIDRLFSVTENGANKINENDFLNNVPIANDYFYATAGALSAREKYSFYLEGGKTYTFSCITYTDADADVANPTSGNGIQFKFEDINGTVLTKPVANNHTTPFDVVYTFTPSNDIKYIYFGYGRVDGNTWHIKDIQIEEGSTQTEYTPYFSLTAVDLVARNAINSITSNYASNADIKYSNGGFSLKAFKELHYTDGTPMTFATCLWIDVNDNFYISDNARSQKKKIFKWDTSLTEFSPEMYSSAVLKDGSILFVFRTQFYNETAEPSDSYRKNPILYVNNNGTYEGQIIDFGSSLKPTNWLQNVGFCEFYNDGCIIFAEYTRGNEATARVWRVTYPITDINNWSVVLSHSIPTPWQSGFKHYHTVQQDPYTGIIYVTSGDNDIGTGIWYSTDSGETFTQLDEYSDAKYRMLNMVFRDDYIYWATDDWAPHHVIWRAERDANGLIDVDSLTVLLTFPSESASQYIATYATVYIPAYNALLILNRIDTNNPDLSTTSIPVLVYDFNDSTLYTAGYVTRAKTAHSQIGFRTEAITFTTRDNKVVCSFSANYPNHNKMLGNADGETRATQVNTVEMTLHKLSNGYSIDYDVIL